LITPQQLKAVFPACMQCGPWVRIFGQMVDEFDLRPDNRFAMFLAQTGYESESFKRLREDMSYSAAELVKTWPHEFPSEKCEAAQRYQRSPAGLANFIYANKNGNGPEGSGDGLKYRGGGLIQLTGKANYTEVGRALNLRLDAAPQLIEQPLIAARTAGYFWKLKDLNAAADAGDFDHITKVINGGMGGADERRALWQKILVQMSIPMPTKGPAPQTVVKPVVQYTRGIAPGPDDGTPKGIMNPDSGFYMGMSGNRPGNPS
jgi:putative chitinase